MFQTYTPDYTTHTTPYKNTLVIEGMGSVIVCLAAEGSTFNVSLNECWHSGIVKIFLFLFPINFERFPGHDYPIFLSPTSNIFYSPNF
jgi:hypothetical protein